ncbi:Motile sperm domain-containing protein 2 [Dermatophagoides farinae]|uniref:Motile sperm domain-containing protein 2 n=1 Tax=Dermatophagoides farinae TaxID=6954 RepID=A0A922L0W1_DERFA|nr:Motile sperm domain-containing protein 2 [Dermatophagoides farinae]
MIDLTFIERLRQRFEKEIETNPSYYHEIDIKRIREEEWPIKRFLIANNADENIAFDSMQRTYRWRNKFGIHDRTDQSFPREFWQLSGVEIIRSINGQFVIIEVLRYQRKCNHLQQLQYQFVAHCLEKVDRIAGENGFIALKDLTNAQHHNINFDLIEFQMIVSDHFPLGLQQIWLVNCPWIIRPFLPIVVNFLFPKFRQLIHYLQSKQLLDSIDREQIPKTLGGLRENQLMIMDTKPLAYMANELGLNEELVDILYKFFNLNRPPPPPPSSSSSSSIIN